ncbi:hypothetical protein [Cellulomonas sp. S1-8]|uniref:hypothetical protein n=1 Tax=Cellulomonas sp. S1-8 TaxID=2904790 RepID=UPI0022445DC7|nr:hypothetical protein [Cellulomonas sp. S1-8]UZN02970.1 hypothetical protein OKX07_18255 [Cellulomonas sp. S1-8]
MPRVGGRLPRALIVTGLALAGSVAVAPAAGAAAVDVQPARLTFAALAAGEVAYATTQLTAVPADRVVVVRATVTGTGPLASSVTTSVESCAAAWTEAGCAAGAAVLVDGWVPADGRSEALDVPVPAGGTAYLRVGVRVAADAPPSTAGVLTYALDLVGPDAPGPSPAPPGGAGGAGVGALPTTGTDVLAAGVAAAALVALGRALRAAARRRTGAAR